MIENKLACLKHLTLLLVDDDTELLDTLKITFSLFFKNVLTASNGVEAIKIHEITSVDMIVTDYVMPHLNGYEFCIEIRKKDKKIPIVIMSNYSEKDKLLNSIPLQLIDYLIKPIDYKILMKTLLSMVNKLEENSFIEEFLSDTICFNIITKKLTKDNHIIPLTKSEIILLNTLLKFKNNIVTEDMFIYAFDVEKSENSQSIKNHIYRLRKKIGLDIILNIKGVGYILRPSYA